MALSADILEEQLRILRLSKQASNIISELEELTGFDFSEAHRGLAMLDELAPRITQVMPRGRAELEVF